MRLEPFVSWLGSTDPLEVSRATLLDVMRLWADSLGIAKTRTTGEVVRDLYACMRESGAPVLPFAAAGLAGFAGIVTVAQSFMGRRA